MKNESTGPTNKNPRANSNRLSLERKDTRAVRKEVVVAGDVLRVATLVEQLQVAWVDSEGLIGVRAVKVTVGDIVGPGGAAVGLAGEGVLLGGSLGSPGAAEAGGSEAAEVAAVVANGLDDHEVLGTGGGTLEGVDLDSLEQVVLAVGHDHRAGGAEVAGEVADGHAGTVDLAVVAGEEQVHVRRVTDDGLVDSAGVRAGDLAREERLSSTPAVDVGGVGAGAVGEGGGTPLVRKNPDLLGREVEQSGRNGVEALSGLAGRGKVGPVVDKSEAEGAVLATRAGSGTVDELLAVVLSSSEVLKGGPAVLGGSERTSGAPSVLGRKSALRGGGGSSHGGEEDVGEMHCWSLVGKVLKECK
jgi:hypothetical protein